MNVNLQSFANFINSNNIEKIIKNSIITFSINIIHAIIIVIFLLILARILIFISNNIIRQNKRRFSEQRIVTLQNIFKNFIKYTMGIVIIIAILISLGVTGQSLLAGAGLFGIIVGLGAKELVADMINGFFTVFENTYDVGEYIMINQYEGYVQSLGVKSTVLKNFNNEIITVPNSSVKEVINFSRQEYVVYFYFKTEQDIPVDYIEKLINEEIITKFKKPEYIRNIEYLGIHNLDINFIEYMLEISVDPEKRFAAERYGNKIIKQIFEEHDLKVPTTVLKVKKDNS